ncbi:UNVERIFIED_CONTAM: hypothetical protein Scaly_0769600 [Sesamum calycinum]|uniref:Uncharacterized protein n=1 Tax=Sesamum calycinum TaxID=2727403 RepID=A0AAW2R8M7_9LAMI
MTALARLLDAGSISQSATACAKSQKHNLISSFTCKLLFVGLSFLLSSDLETFNFYNLRYNVHILPFPVPALSLALHEEEVGHQKLAAQYIKRELGEADEANLLDEEELCKSLSSRAEISLELDGPAVNKKPPRKERKKLLISQTKKATSLREPKKFESVDSDDIAASESHVNEKIQMSSFAEAKRNMHFSSTEKMNGSRVNPYTINCAEDVTKRASKPLKSGKISKLFIHVLRCALVSLFVLSARTAAESPSNPGTKNFCKPAADILPYAPAPLATKVYYSQRNHHLRRAISYMFFEEPSKESSSEVSNLEILQVNAVPQQTSSPSNCYHEQVANQQRDDHFSHLAQTPDQILAARSDFFVGQSEGFVPSMNMASQHPVNNTLGPHYISNSYSFAGKAGNSLGTLQQGSGSVPVV